jgi:hypothetical protein
MALGQHCGIKNSFRHIGGYMNGDANIQRLAQRIAQLIVENELLRQELMEVQNGGNEQHE